MMNKLFWCVILVCASCCVVHAYPTLAGPTGTGVLPNAGTFMPDGSQTAFTAALDCYELSPEDSVALVRYGVNVGKFEFGYGGDVTTLQPYNTYSDYDDDDDWDNDDWEDDEHSVESVIAECLFQIVAHTLVDPYVYAENRQYNLKYRLASETNGDGTAIGFRHGRTYLDGIDPCSTNQLYLVATSTLQQGSGDVPHLRGSLGANWTQRELYGHYDSVLRPFVGAEAYFGKQLSLAADYQVKAENFDSDPMYSVALRAQPVRYATINLGYTNMAVDGVSGADHGYLFAGMNLFCRW